MKVLEKLWMLAHVARLNSYEFESMRVFGELVLVFNEGRKAHSRLQNIIMDQNNATSDIIVFYVSKKIWVVIDPGGHFPYWATQSFSDSGAPPLNHAKFHSSCNFKFHNHSVLVDRSKSPIKYANLYTEKKQSKEKKIYSIFSSLCIYLYIIK